MVASPQSSIRLEARTGVSCGSTRPKKSYSRQSEPLQEQAEHCKQSFRAMPQIAHADQLNEVIPPGLDRCPLCQSVSALSSLS